MIKIADKIMISVILIILTIPCIAMFSGIEPSIQITENRQLSKLPAIGFSMQSFLDYPKQFNRYFLDNYGFRQYLSHLHLRLMIDVLKVPIIKEMIVGKRKWLFWGGDSILNTYRSSEPLAKNELEQFKEIHQKQYQYCTGRGIKYLFVTPPNKFAMYPEFLPEFLTIENKNISHADQLFTYLKNNTSIELIDIKSPLLEAKKKSGKIYFESDSHWNNIGAFACYTEMMKKINEWFPQIKPYQLSDFIYGKTVKKDAELANILGLPEHTKEVYRTLTPKIPYIWERTNTRDKFYIDNNLLFPKTMSIINKKNNSGLKAVMFIDSFSFAMAPLFNQHFKRIIYVYKVLGYDNFDTRIIDYENPDIVISEIGERFFLKIP